MSLPVDSEPDSRSRAGLTSLSGDGGSRAFRFAIAYAILVPFTFQPGGIRFSLADVVLVVGVLATISRLRLIRSAWNPWLVGLGAVLLTRASMQLASGTLTSWAVINKLGGYLSLLLLYLLVINAAPSVSRVRQIGQAYLISCVVSNAIAVILFLGPESPGSGLVEDVSGRFAGFSPDPNAYGGVLVVAIALALSAPWSYLPKALRRHARWVRNVVSLGAIVSLGVGLFLTNSRSAWIALAVAVVVLAVLAPSKMLAANAAILLGLGVVAWSAASLTTRQQFIELSTRTRQITARMDMIGESLQAYLQSPFVGSGLGSYKLSTSSVVHNSLIWLLSEMGPLGAVVFALAVIWTGHRAITLSRSGALRDGSIAIGLAAAHIAMVAFSFGVEALYQRQWWLVMALVGALVAVAARSGAGVLPTHSGEER